MLANGPSLLETAPCVSDTSKEGPFADSLLRPGGILKLLYERISNVRFLALGAISHNSEIMSASSMGCIFRMKSWACSDCP